MNRHTLLGLIGLLLPAVAHAADLPPKVFPHPDRIRYDSQCFTIEGKDTFIFSGAFHYFRCPKELWNDRFDKIKAAGFNCVETYVAWNVQEPAMPASVDDYSKVDMKDLDDWLTMAEAHGLYVILRPGPYICAEWDCGGFPQWLLTKKPADYHTGHMWLRSDDPIFVAWSKHWFHAVDQVAVKHQITHRAPGTGGIIIYQLENEYGGNQPEDVEVRYIHALGQQALDDGIDVPFMTCWTAVVRGSADPILRQCYDSCNFYPRWNVDSIGPRIDQLRKEQPDAPLETTELQGGWFGNVGSKNSLPAKADGYIDGCTPAQIQNLTLYAIAKGDRVTNYYMLFGGTNFGDYAPAGITTSYDYSAPIRECGGVDEKYQRVAAIGRFIETQGSYLARAKPIPCTSECQFKDVSLTMFQSSEMHSGMYAFVRTTNHTEGRKGTIKFGIGVDARDEFSIDFDLEPFGSTVFFLSNLSSNSNKWVDLFKSASPGGAAEVKSIEAISRPSPAELPTAVDLKFVGAPNSFGDMPTAWQPLAEGTTLEQLGVYDRRYVFYRAHVKIEQGQITESHVPSLRIDAPRRDHLVVAINGHVDPTMTGPGTHRAAGLGLGDNTIDILYQNVGQPNGGPGMEEMSGVRRISLADPSEAATGGIDPWQMHKIPAGDKPWTHANKLPEIGADFDATAWPSVKTNELEASQLVENESAVFRTVVDVSAEQAKIAGARLVLDRMDDAGWVFVNGQKIGEGHAWSDQFSFPVTLKEGKNTIAILIRNTEGHGGLGPVHLEFGPAKPGLPMEIGLQSQGFAEKWWMPDAAKWSEAQRQVRMIAELHPTSLSWSRATFELPAAKPHIWVPWVARLDLPNDANLYLNGHPLGRYWKVGPQHDFFLPECWMNFGPGKTNTLTLCGPSPDGKMPTATMAVVPLNELAEVRP